MDERSGQCGEVLPRLHLCQIPCFPPKAGRHTLPWEWEQRYLILECKVGVFEDVIHEDNEFAHDGSERNFGWFAGST